VEAVGTGHFDSNSMDRVFKPRIGEETQVIRLGLILIALVVTIGKMPYRSSSEDDLGKDYAE
jgi:hypothetical protein